MGAEVWVYGAYRAYRAVKIVRNYPTPAYRSYRVGWHVAGDSPGFA